MRFQFQVHSNEAQSSVTGLSPVICGNLDRNHRYVGNSVHSFFVMLAINLLLLLLCSRCQPFLARPEFSEI